MQSVKASNMVHTQSGSKNKFLILAIIIFVLIAAGLIYKNSRKTEPNILLAKTVISQSVLEEKYGLHVNLVAVTAAGGMVDLRLKIIDGEKAKLLLQDNNNFPALYVNDSNITLNVSEEDKSQEIKFENGGNIFLMFPNAGNAVKPGTAIHILFGDLALESIESK